MQGTYTLYIHASNDVIKSVQIQLDKVWQAPDVAWSILPGQAMAREVAAQIHQTYPKARATEQIAALEVLLKFMNQLSGTYLEGIIVRVPGIIDPPPTAQAPAASAQIQQQITQLTQHYQQQMQQERAASLNEKGRLEQELASVRSQVQLLQANMQRLLDVELRYQDALARLQQEQQAGEGKKKQLQRAQEDLKNALYENGKLLIDIQLKEDQLGKKQEEIDKLHEKFATFEKNMQRQSKDAMKIQRERDEAFKDLKDIQKQFDDLQKKLSASPEMEAASNSTPGRPKWVNY